MDSHDFASFYIKEPLLFVTSPAALLDEAVSLIETTVTVVDSIVSQVTLGHVTFENTLKPFSDNENTQATRDNYIRFFFSTSPVEELRDASSRATTLLSNAEADLFSRKDLFVLFDDLWTRAQNEPNLLPDEQTQIYLSKLHKHFLSYGCGITDDEIRNKFTEKKKRLDEVTKQMQRNMADEQTGLWLSLDEFEGVPDILLTRLEHGKEDNSNLLWLPTKTPFSTPVLTYARREQTREKVYRARLNRVPANIPLFREMVMLRDETARYLGWPHHLAYKSSGTMLKTSEAVQKLLMSLREVLAEKAEERAQRLFAMKRREMSEREDLSSNATLYFWDRAYLDNKIPGQNRLHQTPISEYLELNTTLQKLFEVFENLFGVKMVPVDASIANGLIWSEDVKLFTAWNIDRNPPEFLGHAYMDLYPRQGKYTHSGHYTLQRGFQLTNGTYHYPASCLVMNYAKPGETIPSLLTLDTVRSLFHEMGHMYHCLLSRAKYARLHSADEDFMEVPSMMLEQFFWNPEFIHTMTHHYSYVSAEYRKRWLSSLPADRKTHDELTIDLWLSMEEIILVNENAKGSRMNASLNLLFYSSFDALVHSPKSREDLEQTEFAELYNKTAREIYRVHGSERFAKEGWNADQGYTVFRGIQGKKKDAAYYFYILGRVFAIDIFETGFSSNLMDRTNARRYRDIVLCRGGSKSALDILREYLGHEPSTEPYLRWLGVKEVKGVQTFG